MSRTNSASGKFDGEKLCPVCGPPDFRFQASHLAEWLGYEIYLYVITGGSNAEYLSKILGGICLAVTGGDVVRAFNRAIDERGSLKSEIVPLADLLNRGDGNKVERITPAEIFVMSGHSDTMLCSTVTLANPLHVARLIAYHMLGYDVPPDMRTALSKLPRVKR